jgi:hypothetical protein
VTPGRPKELISPHDHCERALLHEALEKPADLQELDEKWQLSERRHRRLR